MIALLAILFALAVFRAAVLELIHTARTGHAPRPGDRL